MKRSKATEGTIRYKNTGGTLLINGQFVKPNEVFHAFPHEVPEAFSDTITALDEIAKKEVEAMPETEMEYVLVDRGNGWFDIVDQDGKKVNETGMRKDKAEEALTALKEGIV